MKRFTVMAFLSLMACQATTQNSSLSNTQINQFAEGQIEVTRVQRGDLSAVIWTDPNRCLHYLGDMPNGEKYIQEIFLPSGEKACLS